MKKESSTSSSSAHAEPATSTYHTPVLYRETLDLLSIRPDGIYVDATFGGGGHSRGILQKLSDKGKLVAFDQDADAARNLPDDKRVVFVPHNFRHLTRFLRLEGITRVDGILADLGVSSHQFDEGARGFSTRFEGPMDMRMDQRASLTAAEVIDTYTEEQLHRMFEQYGEVTNSKTLAQLIVAERRRHPSATIQQFKTLIHAVVKGNPNKYLAQVFQALRIEVNEEIASLQEMLGQLPALLVPGGRAAIISFHSLEDRIVKNFFREGGTVADDNPFTTGKREKIFRMITAKPVTAGVEEIKNNPRSRSAKLRVAEKI